MELHPYLESLGRAGRRQYFREYERQRKTWPETMQRLPLPEGIEGMLAQWRSRYYLASLWQAVAGMQYLNINRIEMDERGEWLPGIPWEDFQCIKQQCGLGLLVGHMVFPDNYEAAPGNIYTMWLREK